MKLKQTNGLLAIANQGLQVLEKLEKGDVDASIDPRLSASLDQVCSLSVLIVIPLADHLFSF